MPAETESPETCNSVTWTEFSVPPLHASVLVEYWPITAEYLFVDWHIYRSKYAWRARWKPVTVCSYLHSFLRNCEKLTWSTVHCKVWCVTPMPSLCWLQVESVNKFSCLENWHKNQFRIRVATGSGVVTPEPPCLRHWRGRKNTIEGSKKCFKNIRKNHIRLAKKNADPRQSRKLQTSKSKSISARNTKLFWLNERLQRRSFVHLCLNCFPLYSTANEQ